MNITDTQLNLMTPPNADTRRLIMAMKPGEAALYWVGHLAADAHRINAHKAKHLQKLVTELADKKLVILFQIRKGKKCNYFLKRTSLKNGKSRGTARRAASPKAAIAQSEALAFITNWLADRNIDMSVVISRAVDDRPVLTALLHDCFCARLTASSVAAVLDRTPSAISQQYKILRRGMM